MNYIQSRSVFPFIAGGIYTGNLKNRGLNSEMHSENLNLKSNRVSIQTVQTLQTP